MAFLTILFSLAGLQARAYADSITPSYGHNTGPVGITDLNSTGFLSGSTVKLTRAGQADIPATAVTVVTSTRIACAFDLRGAATGYWAVVVTSLPFSQTLSSTFEIRPLQVDSISPAAGYNTGPVSVIDLLGGGFVAGSTVALALDGEFVPATGVSVLSSTRITCAFDLRGKTTGYWDVVVTTGSLSQTLAGAFAVNLMQVLSITPSLGYNTGPFSITGLAGEGFVAGSTVALSLNGEFIPATAVTVVTSTKIICAFDLRGKTTGYWDVVVTTGPFSRTLSGGFGVSLMQLVSITPDTGYNTGPVNITDLRGAGFVAGSTVALTRAGETPVLSTGVPSVITSTRIMCAFDLRGKTTGYWSVVVTTGSLTQTLDSALLIGLMEIASMSPSSGYNTSSVSITNLYGAGFVAGSTVALTRPGETPVLSTGPVSVITSTRILCAFDLRGKTTGYWDVTVTTGAFSQTLSSAILVEQMQAISMTPSSGYNTGPVSITDLRGEGFLVGSTVALTRAGETPVLSTGAPSVLSSTRITCAFDLRGQATGYWDVTVTSGAFSHTLSSAILVYQMQIVSIVPSAGYNTGVVSITNLQGAGFVAGSTVALTRAGETPVLSTGVPSVISSTRITCAFDLRGKTTGYWDVTVTTGAFSQTLSSAILVDLMQIVSIMPPAGYNTGVVSITDLRGEGFVAGSTVALTRVGETPVLSTGTPSVLSSTRITCAFDLTGKATGYWNLTVTTGAFSQTLNNAFLVDQMQIFSIMPSGGPNTGPVNITDLRGEGFQAGSTVLLIRAGEPAIAANPVTVVTSTRITCTFDLAGAATGYWNVVVTTNSYSQTLSDAFAVSLLQVVSIMPDAGYNTGPVSITNLRGEGFLAGSTVALTRDGETAILANPVTVVTSTRITCVFDLQGKATGYWDVTVTSGSFSQTLPGGFGISLMQVLSITPYGGYNSGPVSVTDLRGEGFVAGSTVALTRAGETAILANPVTVVTSTRITCTFDLAGAATGYWNVVVTTGSFSQTLSGGFGVSLMQVASIAPAAGFNTGPLGITDLLGEGFPASSAVRLTRAGQADITASGVTVVTSTRITCTFNLISQVTGYWNVVVSTGGTGSVSAALPNGFFVNAIRIDSIAPAHGYNTGLVSITDLLGEGFASYTTLVKLKRAGQPDISATDIFVESPNKITCSFNLTGKAAGYWDVYVASGAFNYTLANAFENRPMDIISVTPNLAANIGSSSATIAGNGFLAGSVVKLSKTGQSDITAATVDVESSTSIACAFDLAGKTTGYWDVTVSSDAFTYTLAGGFEINSLLITLLTPAAGYNNGSVRTAISGIGLLNGTSFALARAGQSDIPGTDVAISASSQAACTFDLTGRPEGYWDVVVTSGSSVFTLADGFWVHSLAVASIAPAVWYNSGVVNIPDLHGGGFAAGASVKLTRTGQDDIPAAGLTIVSTAQISCSFDLTGKEPGYWSVVVATGGTGSLSAALTDGFLVSALSLASITPNSTHNTGPVNISDLHGGGFAAGASVKLVKAGQSDIAATSVVIESQVKITCAFDLTGKTTGYWDVVVSTGGAGSLSAALTNGLLVSPLGVTSVTPASGYNSGAVSVTDLRGGGFVDGSSVKLAKTGQSDIPATGVTVVSSVQISCSFALAGKATGYWDVVVSTGGAGSLSAALAGGFLLEPFSASSITPAAGDNAGSVGITDLHGGGFAAVASVKLARAGQADIPATGVTVVNQVQISCSFDLTGKTTGYWDVVVSTGGAGSLSVTLAQGFEVIYPLVETAVINSTIYSSVTLQLVSGDVNIEMPAGTFSQNVSLTVSTAPVPASDRGTIIVSNLGVQISNSLGLQPLKDTAITVYYRDSDITGLDETKLALGRYDPVNARWIPLPSTAYPALNKVTGTTDHFSVFSLIQLRSAANLSSIKAYPNPYDPGRHAQGLIIDNLTAAAEIKIFTITGELVKKVEYTTGNGQAVWRGTNEAGRKVASGVYLVLIKSSAGETKIKIAVEK